MILLASSSKKGRILLSLSYKFTLKSNKLNIVANSHPVIPAPSMFISLSFNESSRKTCSGIIPPTPISPCFEPVARMIISVFIFLLSTKTVFSSSITASPSIKFIFFDKEIAPGGYIFTAKTKDNKCVLGVGLDRIIANKSLEYYLEKAKSHKTISKILDSAKISNTFSGFAKYGILEKHSMGNILLTGDAGRFGDPFFCYGVRQSILSGYNAAEICKKTLDANLYLESGAKYESSMKELQNEIKLGLFLRSIYNKLDNKDIDVIVKIISDAQKDGLDLDYIFKKNNNLLIKNILKNMNGCFSITLKTLPRLVEYLLKIRNI